MLVSNNSYAAPQCFILNGIPGLEALHTWRSLPLCTMYIISLMGNFGLVYLICYEESLHHPMYFFLAMLSLVDLFTCTTTLPNVLFIFWFKLKEISFTACLVQMFLVHGFMGVESGVLMLMTLDCYVAICYPLSYATILTNSVIAKVGLATFLRGVLLMIPFPFLVKRLPFCQSNVISHTYCDHMSVLKLSCASIKINVIYGLMVALLIGAFDICCISVSYTMILQTVVSLFSAESQQKAFSTCTAHISAIIITYVPAFFTFFTHVLGGHTIPPSLHIIVANLYLLLPPTLNPIVYGMKTKQIRDSIIKFFHGEKGSR
ncbi:LOW QUALITY PROTEIN: olfactory receptor 52N5-like [Microtus oregoni]|uniref:LOW QUALITY PROTEIN: olfactory receptor 52N5-like n=1 Tax=Microtus oregoni TaxID=111838 RepID=UPI001BB14A5C|nr:LOW QUALITY PROTEIN: olfactory receptor 52N5-like [Microtus oregoni]